MTSQNETSNAPKLAPAEPVPLWRAFAASAVGIEMGLYVIIGFFVGRYLDGRLGSEPAAMIGLVLFGVVLGVFAMVRASRAAWKAGPASKSVSAGESQ